MADIRFNRIAVSVFDTHPLEWYFTRRERMEKATLYVSLYDEWDRKKTDDVLRTAEFLETLYSKDPSKLSSLLSYIVNDLPQHLADIYPRDRVMIRIYSMAHRREQILRELQWFFRELETIGITWDGRGARALMSNNPDNLSQSISSMRELLTGVLHLLTEKDAFSGDELTDSDQPKRRARIRHILARSKGLGAEAGLAEAIANTLDKTYNTLNKGFHVTGKKDWGNILYVFKSAEYLVYYILLNR